MPRIDLAAPRESNGDVGLSVGQVTRARRS